MDFISQEDLSQAILFFAGVWLITREITSLRDGSVIATGEGVANFSFLSPDELSFFEEGTLWLQPSHTRVRFFKSFRYSFSHGKMTVSFADGPDAGKMYQIYTQEENRWVPTEKHQCRKDQYDSCYEMENENAFRLITVTVGTNKDYRAVTRFRRQAS